MMADSRADALEPVVGTTSAYPFFLSWMALSTLDPALERASVFGCGACHNTKAPAVKTGAEPLGSQKCLTLRGYCLDRNRNRRCSRPGSWVSLLHCGVLATRSVQ